MRLPEWLRAKLAVWAQERAQTPPDFIIGAQSPGGAYMHRWYIIPRNRWFNIYLHRFLRSDEDEALHDHPWANCSILLWGAYIEHTIAAGGCNVRKLYPAGTIKLRLSGKLAHRVELLNGKVLKPHPPGQGFLGGGVWQDYPRECLTIFITGPMYREWGFHCPNGWRKFSDFAALKAGTSDRGKGCD